jgi:DNA topoisomerase-2
MIVDKQLVIANRKKADIVSELRRLNFRPFPKISQAKKRGEKEPVLDDLEDREALRQEEEETGTSTDFDYLLGMAIWSLTREKVQNLEFTPAVS